MYIQFTSCVYGDFSHFIAYFWIFELLEKMSQYFVTCLYICYSQILLFAFLFRLYLVAFMFPNIILPKPNHRFVKIFVEFVEFLLNFWKSSASSKFSLYIVNIFELAGNFLTKFECATRNYSKYTPWYMVSIDDVIDLVTWLLLEILFGEKLLTWNFNLHTSYQAEVWM